MSGMEILQVASGVMTIVGGLDQASQMRESARRNADNANAAAAANQRQLEYSAGQEQAAGQHKAEQDRRKAALMLSRAQALAAAGGGGPLDESLMSGILDAGEKEAGYTMYGANERAAGLRYRGEVGVGEARAKGEQAVYEAGRQARATTLGAFAKGVGMGAGGFSKFFPSAPPGAAEETIAMQNWMY